MDKRLLDIYKTIGVNVSKARGGMNKTKLAEKSGVSRNTIIAIENGKPISLKKLLQLAIALGIQASELFLSENEQASKEISFDKYIRLIVKDQMNQRK